MSDATGKQSLLWLVAIGFFMESLDTTILNTAVPTIAQALGVAPLSMKAVLASYTLSLAIFIPVSGWVAYRFGTRRVFGSAVAIFTLGSFLCGMSRSIHWLVACRILQGCGGAMMLPVGRLTLVRAFSKPELVRAMSFVATPGLIGPMLGPLIGGLIIAYFHWRVIFFINIPVGLAGLYLVCRHMPDYRREEREPLDFVGFLLFGSGISLLSYLLEIFGEHTLSGRRIGQLLGLALALLAAYGVNSARIAHPLLPLALMRIRSFRVAISGNLLTRLGIGGVPFLLPLLYQVGLGFSPIQSGLLILPQAVASMSLKLTMPRLLEKFGYRRVLIVNTICVSGMIMLFSTIGVGTRPAVIVLMALAFGFLASLQYTGMNTLTYADVDARQAGGASTIASTVQQMAMSFGVATASLAAALFIPDRFQVSPAQMIRGIHLALLLLGALTLVSTVLFGELRVTDGAALSRHEKQKGPDRLARPQA